MDPKEKFIIQECKKMMFRCSKVCDITTKAVLANKLVENNSSIPKVQAENRAKTT
jgi:hypothetical protein